MTEEHYIKEQHRKLKGLHSELNFLKQRLIKEPSNLTIYQRIEYIEEYEIPNIEDGMNNL